jgi:hypothetical protein
VEPVSATEVAALLRQLSGVIPKQEFGNEVFLVGPNRFAAVTSRALLLRLPPADLTAALRLPGARPFVSVGAMGRHGWVQIRLGTVGREEIERLVRSAHAAALSGHRRSAIKKPARARHVRAKRTT